jgi:hypothetical protein
MANPNPRDWLKALGTLTVGNANAAEADARLNAYAPLLMSRFDAAAFTAESLEHVAGNCKFFPAYGELVEHLAAWWKENRPRETRLAIAGPRVPMQTESGRLEGEGPSEEEREAVSRIVKAFVAERSEGARLRPSGVEPKYLTGEALERHRASSPLVEQARRFAAERAIKAEESGA